MSSTPDLPAQRTVTTGFGRETVRLAVYKWPAPEDLPDAPTVVLLHGYPDNAGVWRRLAERLRASCRVVAYDVRGAGRSSRPRGIAAYRFEHLMGDLAAVLDAVSPDAPVHLVGHDWGSIQGWEAVSGTALAGRIASFTSISGPCLDHMGHWLRRSLKSGGHRDDLRALVKQFRASWYIGAFHLPLLPEVAWQYVVGERWPGLLQRMERLAQVDDNPTQTDDGAAGVALYRANILPRLLKPRARQVLVPVQAVLPERERFVSPGILTEEAPRWTLSLTHAALAGGHWVQLSQPDALAALLLDHVAAHPAPRLAAA